MRSFQSFGTVVTPTFETSFEVDADMWLIMTFRSEVRFEVMSE